MKPAFTLFAALIAPLFAADVPIKDLVVQKLAADYESLDALYKHFHANPELSLMEEKTAARLATELRAIGCDVTEKFGGYGVVAVLKNGAGLTLLIRADMILAALLLLPRLAMAAPTPINWWHSHGGTVAEKIKEICDGFNQSQSEYQVVPAFKGNYAATMNAGIAAARAKNSPHVLAVYEVGTATMMAAKGVPPQATTVRDSGGRILPFCLRADVAPTVDEASRLVDRQKARSAIFRRPRGGTPRPRRGWLRFHRSPHITSFLQPEPKSP